MATERAILKFLMKQKADLYTEWEQGFMHGLYFGSRGHQRDILGDLCKRAGFTEDAVEDEANEKS